MPPALTVPILQDELYRDGTRPQTIWSDFGGTDPSLSMITGFRVQRSCPKLQKGLVIEPTVHIISINAILFPIPYSRGERPVRMKERRVRGAYPICGPAATVPT